MGANLMSLAQSGGKFLKLFGDRKMMKTMPTARDYVQDGLAFIVDDTFETLETERYDFVLDSPIAPDSDFTVEICCEIEDDGTDGVIHNARILIGKGTVSCLGFAWFSASAYNTLNLQTGSYRWSLRNQPIFSKNTYGAVSTNGESPSSSFIHGGNVTYAGPAFLEWKINNEIHIGKLIGNKNGFRGKVFNVRIYSRALTADEIAHNYAIDKARFGIP